MADGRKQAAELAQFCRSWMNRLASCSTRNFLDGSAFRATAAIGEQRTSFMMTSSLILRKWQQH